MTDPAVKVEAGAAAIITQEAPPHPDTSVKVEPAPDDSWFWRRSLTIGQAVAAWLVVAFCAWKGGDSVKDTAIMAAVALAGVQGFTYTQTARQSYRDRLEYGARRYERSSAGRVIE